MQKYKILYKTPFILYNNTKFNTAFTFIDIGVNKQTIGKLLQPSCSRIHQGNPNFISLIDWFEGIF